MGVFRLFRYFLNKYPTIVSQLKDKQSTKDLNIDIDVLAIDLNAIFHPCCQDIFGYGKSKQNEFRSLLHRKPKIQETYEVLVKKSYKQITYTIEELVKQNNPKQILYLAVDGVAGMSKQTQQRQRRFRYAKDIDNNTFDSNSISTGTVYMDNLCKFITTFIKIKLKNDWKHLQIIFNNNRVVGEGEHKLIHYIKKLPKHYSISIVSPDADLIMLSLALNRENIFVFRENIFDDFEGKFFLVHIDKLKSKIINDIKPFINEKLNDKTDLPKLNSSVEYYIKRKNLYGNVQDQNHRMIEDFIFYIFMLGNDFLPHIPSLEISNDGIEHLLHCYNIVINNHGYISYHSNGDIKINLKSFKELTKELASLELKMLYSKIKKRITFPDVLLENNIIITKQGRNINYEKFRY
jgi:5'-3' exonuclease